MDSRNGPTPSPSGQHASNLPTPSLVISLPILRRNIQRLHAHVEALGIAFRPHVKTLKSLEVTKLMLGDGKYRKVVASTIPEILGCLPLAKAGQLDECIYGMPIYPGAIARLAEISRSMNIALMLDNVDQIPALEASLENLSGNCRPWQVYIKIDVGSHRAGVEVRTQSLEPLVQAAEQSSAVSIAGFYCHAGHSYNCRSPAAAAEVLHTEYDSVLAAARLLPADRPLIVSIGATPTAHVIEKLRLQSLPNITLELHAGNFPVNDLQQVSTGLVTMEDQAARVCAEVCSVYPERNEALLNAGVIALSRETSAYPGFGILSNKPHLGIVRVSQEHGIVGQVIPAGAKTTKIDHELKVGDKVFLYCQHACITAAAFAAYTIVDENDTVVDTWVPWKGW